MKFRFNSAAFIAVLISTGSVIAQTDYSPRLDWVAQMARANPLFGYRVGPGAARMDKPILRPFSTDGCSQSPNEFPNAVIVECCVKHDVAYWLGGTAEEKLASDENLEQCIAAKTNALTGKAYRAGVAIGGTPLGYNSFRWGYGWDTLRPYGPLSSDEIIQAENLYGKELVNLKDMVQQGRYKITFDFITLDYDQINRFSDDVIVYYFLQNKLKRQDDISYGQKMQLTSLAFRYNIRLKSCGDQKIGIKFNRMMLIRDYLKLRTHIHAMPWAELKKYIHSVDDPGRCLG